MARIKTPTIPDDKKRYFSEQLARELSHMFVWENLPTTVPRDYLERQLIRHGYVLFYESEEIGHDVLRCEVVGYNRHERPTHARTYTPNTSQERVTIERNLRYLTEYDNVEKDFDPQTDGVLIRNMELGQNAWDIIEHFSERLVLAQMAFDTNLLYANMPYIFQTGSDDTRLSIEKMFEKMFKGEPFIITDKELFTDNKDKAGEPTNIPFIAKDIFDVKNEIMMDFRQTVGIDTAGVEKAERVNTLEIESNEQHTQTVLQIMKEQREMAVENINAFFNLDVKVSVRGEQEQLPYAEDVPEEVAENGNNNSGIEEPTQD